MIRAWWLALLAAAAGGCATIQPYSIVVTVPTQTLLPPSAELNSYTRNSGLSLQLERTTNFCGEVKQAIAREIDQRQNRLTTRRSVLVLIGSIAALITTVYAGIEDDPKKGVVVPLGAVSGGTLLTSLPSLGQDERVAALRDKLAAIKARESNVVESWNELERGLLDVGVLRIEQGSHERGDAEWRKVQTALDAKYQELAPVEDRFRGSLANLSNECS